MTTDLEGKLWIAQWDGFCLSRFRSRHGRASAEGAVPGGAGYVLRVRRRPSRRALRKGLYWSSIDG
nr:SMP-30/gluconolactonase/LRE family protein [Paenibacillus rhizovicinus]